MSAASRMNSPRPVVVEGLAMGDREQPAAEVLGVAQPRVGAQGGDHRLLEHVVRVDRPDVRGEEPQDGRAVVLDL